MYSSGVPTLRNSSAKRVPLFPTPLAYTTSNTIRKQAFELLLGTSLVESTCDGTGDDRFAIGNCRVSSATAGTGGIYGLSTVLRNSE